jgi:hypothetical protein
MPAPDGSTPPLEPPPPARAGAAPSLSQVLRELGDDACHERVSVGDLLQALQHRAVAALLFVFAVPNVVPAPPGTSALLGAPLLVLAFQLAFGLRPWLPGFITRRSMARNDFQSLMRRLLPGLMRAERLLRPRASWLATGLGQRVAGLVCLLLAIVLILPVPLGNILPALAISVMALGLLERDGLWVLAGVGIAVVSGLVVWGVIYALIEAAVYLVLHVLQR